MKLRLLLGIAVCFSASLLMGVTEVSSQNDLDALVGGATGNCNIDDGHNFNYTDCTGGTACDGQWRHYVGVPGFGAIIHFYENVDHCEEENSACDPHQSFEKTGSEEEGTCIKPIPAPF